MKNKIQNPPILITGMHRSGTTLLVKLLMKLGYFPGYKLDNNLESIFFQRVNEWLMKRAGGAWDYPLPIKNLFNSTSLKKQIIKFLLDEMSSLRFSEYSGKNKEYNKNIWGWKDPRLVFTIDLWKDIFPDLKLIIIRRNGIDVANSLFKRQVYNLKNGMNPFFIYSLKKRIKDAIRPIESFNFQSCRCTTLQGCFELWEEYQNEADNLYMKFNGNKLYICYEDLLLDPENMVGQLKQFLPINIDAKGIQDIIDELNSKRAFAFKNDNNLHEFYLRVKDRKLMKKYGYNDLL